LYIVENYSRFYRKMIIPGPVIFALTVSFLLFFLLAEPNRRKV
jgi:hypothetical protein